MASGLVVLIGLSACARVPDDDNTRDLDVPSVDTAPPPDRAAPDATIDQTTELTELPDSGADQPDTTVPAPATDRAAPEVVTIDRVAPEVLVIDTSLPDLPPAVDITRDVVMEVALPPCGGALAGCNPVTRTPCAAGQGCAPTSDSGGWAFRCIPGGSGVWGASCARLSECRPGFICLGLPGHCTKVCCPGNNAHCQDVASGGRPTGRCAGGITLQGGQPTGYNFCE